GLCGSVLMWGGGGDAGEPQGSPASLSISAHSSFQARSIILGSRWMTTLRNEPTARPTAKETSGKTAGWVSASIVPLIRALGALLDRLTDLEYRQVPGADHSPRRPGHDDHATSAPSGGTAL